ncbi:MAG: oligosaccharide flippase family protein [Coriobacteriia bacterium]|nr:oligosaccharide flippase family protein [Coriobacteriia bacterium]
MLKNALRSAGRDALTYFPVRFLPALTSLITVPVFTRFIDPADYGFFYLVSAATSLTTTLATGWISPSVIRYYWPCEKEGKQDGFTATTLWLALASVGSAAIVVGLAVLALAPRLDPSLTRLVPAALGAFLASSLVTTLQQVQRAANRAKPYARVANTVTALVTVVSVCLVWRVGAGSLGILLGTLTGNALVLPVVISRMHRDGSLSPGSVDRGLVSEYASYGLPIMLANISSWALVLSDRYILGALRDAAEVGLYSVTYSLGEKIMQLVVTPLVLTMGPVMVQTWEKQGQKLAQQVQTQFTRYYLMVTLPLLLGMQAVAQEFMAVFTGPDYRSAYHVLGIVAAGSLCYGLTQIAGTGVALHKKSSIIMTNTMLAAGFQIGANLLLVPRFGYAAAAWNTLASYLLLLGVTWIRSRPYMAWHLPWTDIARIAGASGIMWVVLALAFREATGSVWMLLGQVGVGIAVYGTLVFAVGVVRRDERQAVWEFLRRAVRR